MAANMQQISHLVSRLLARTQAKDVRWSQTAEPGKHQIRFGDFSITISPVGAQNAVSRDILLQVQKLSGDPVTSITTQSGALAALLGANMVADPITAGKLRSLYSAVADRNDDLDDLLKLIG